MSQRRGFTLIELLVVIAIIAILIALLVPAVQKVRESAAITQCKNNLKQIGLGLQGYHDINKVFPPGYMDGNTDPNSTPDNDKGPGWGWAALILPYLEAGSVYDQIDFKTKIGVGKNVAVSQQALLVYQCPTDDLQQAFPVYDSSFGAPIAMVAHSNYVGCSGWEECFNGAGGNPGSGSGTDGDAGGLGKAGVGIFYRNSRNSTSNVTDGLSNTIFVGERSSNHSPSTWTGAVTGGRCPAWMANQPPTPYAPPPSLAYDNADYGEALIFAHANATHLPNLDFPASDPDTFYSLHPYGVNFLFGDGSVHFIRMSIDPTTYQSLSTIAGNDLIQSYDW